MHTVPYSQLRQHVQSRFDLELGSLPGSLMLLFGELDDRAFYRAKAALRYIFPNALTIEIDEDTQSVVVVDDWRTMRYVY